MEGTRFKYKDSPYVPKPQKKQSKDRIVYREPSVERCNVCNTVVQRSAYIATRAQYTAKIYCQRCLDTHMCNRHNHIKCSGYKCDSVIVKYKALSCVCGDPRVYYCSEECQKLAPNVAGRCTSCGCMQCVLQKCVDDVHDICITCSVNKICYKCKNNEVNAKIIYIPQANIPAIPVEALPIEKPLVEESKEDPNCVVCMDNKKCMVAVPCGHISICEACAPMYTPKEDGKLTPCVMCRLPVEKAIKTFT